MINQKFNILDNLANNVQLFFTDKHIREKICRAERDHKVPVQPFHAGTESQTKGTGDRVALHYACNLPTLWKLGGLETKRVIQYMVFPNGIGYDFKNK